MKSRIAIFTSARSDFGPLRPLMEIASQRFQVTILIGGAHFLASRGNTSQEVYADAARWGTNVVPVEFMLEGASPANQVRSIAVGQIAISQWLAGNACNAMVILGDRWELFAASLPAFLYGIPLIHISGGEVTEGVIDDCVRHAHSKLSHLHFVANDFYADNLSRMGEEDWRITLAGECGIDSIHHQDLATVEEVKAQFGIDLSAKPILVTFHPSTLDSVGHPIEQFEQLLTALDRIPSVPVVLTAPGVELGAAALLERLINFVKHRNGAHFIPHLGSRAYLTVLKNASLVLGNSSSGLVEAASFGVPAVNVGDRQKNRLAAESVLHVPAEAQAISDAMTKALDPIFQTFSRTCANPYDPYRDGRNSERIAHVIDRALLSVSHDRILLKRFDPVLRPEKRNAFLKDFQ